MLSLLTFLLLFALPFVSLAANPSWDNSTKSPFQPIELAAPDDSIRGSFLPYGATIASLFVKDSNGTFQDVVLGYDNKTMYADDASKPNFGPIVGRYANRIKNNTFTDPVNGHVFNSDANENGGLDTLHGGPYGWSYRPWTVINVTESTVTFAFYDPAGLGGFPGSVIAEIKYSLLSGGIWDLNLYAKPSSRTPLLLSSHVYWNFDGYSVMNSTAKDWVLHLPYADKVVATDTILIPTGEFTNVSGTAYDFTEPHPIGYAWNETLGFPGLGGLGYDTAFVNADYAPALSDPKLIVYSPHTGIKLEVYSPEPAIQIYTCGGQKGTEPRKASQGGGVVEQYSCMVIEMEGVIDAINNPQWGIDQWYSPSRPYNWQASYHFSLV